MRHCYNCGAHIDPYTYKCPYCGGIYYDFSALDCEADKPVYIKFRTNYMGQPMTVTALARPSLETVEMTSDETYATDTRGTKLASFTTERNCDLVARFRCMADGAKLFRVEVEEE